MPNTLLAEEFFAYCQIVENLRVDNFGSFGTRLIFQAIGVLESAADLRERAVKRFPQFSPESEASRQHGSARVVLGCFVMQSMKLWQPTGMSQVSFSARTA